MRTDDPTYEDETTALVALADLIYSTLDPGPGIWRNPAVGGQPYCEEKTSDATSRCL